MNCLHYFDQWLARVQPSKRNPCNFVSFVVVFLSVCFLLMLFLSYHIKYNYQIVSIWHKYNVTGKRTLTPIDNTDKNPLNDLIFDKSSPIQIDNTDSAKKTWMYVYILVNLKVLIKTHL